MEMNQPKIKQDIRGFINSNFYVADAASLSDGESLLGEGIIDSTGVLELIAFIESTFGIIVDDSEMLPENLDSIESMVRFVARKSDAYAGQPVNIYPTHLSGSPAIPRDE